MLATCVLFPFPYIQTLASELCLQTLSVCVLRHSQSLFSDTLSVLRHSQPVFRHCVLRHSQSVFSDTLSLFSDTLGLCLDTVSLYTFFRLSD